MNTTSRLKIFIIGPAYPLRGGPAQLNENLCAELLARGHNAQIISYSLQYPEFLFPGSSQFEKSGSSPVGISIHTLINTVNPLSWYKTARFIKREQPDFVLFRFWLPFFGPALGTIARLVKKHTKVLALTDNVIPHEKRVGDAVLTRYFLRSCFGFITMSRSVMDDLGKFTANPRKVYSPHPMYETYGPVMSKEEARDKLGIAQHEKIVLFFGLIRQYKGLDILLEAMAHPEIKQMNIRLLIAGEFYEDKKPYLDLIAKNEMEAQVLLHDHFIGNEEVRYYFCASDLVAQTYRNATNSGVTMVGYYYDKPLLVTNVGGLAEIVPHNICGYVVDPSVQQISNAILDFYKNRREEGFAANVALEKQKYGWDAFIGKLLEVFQMDNP